ncbi:MAG TPA: MFS transporter [Bryobacteraceae bacterium]|nr:MFS transporter [Bryobacteraceae bacterium]
MRNRIVTLMFLFSVMSYFDRTILSIAAPGIMKEFSISEIEMGVVFSAFLASYTLTMIPGGGWADRYGPRNVFTFFAVGSGLATALFSLGAKPGLGSLLGIIPAFVAIRLILGVVTAPIYPTAAKMTSNWMRPHQHARVMGIVNGGAGLGGAVSPLLFTWMIVSFGWRASFLMAGAATVLLGLVWHYSAQDYPPGSKPVATAGKRRVDWKKLFRNRRLMTLTAGYFAIDYFEYIFFYWIYYYLGVVKKMGQQESAVATTLLFIVMMFMYPLGGWTADWFNRRYGKPVGLKVVGIGGVVLSAICLFAGLNVENVPVSIGLTALALGFVACSDVVYWAAMIDVSGPDAGAGGGIMNAGGNLGGFFAPIVTPWIAAHFGWTWGLYFGSLLALSTVLVWMYRSDRTPSE